MSFLYKERSAASGMVDIIWHTVDESDGMYLAAADGCWDMLFTKTPQGKMIVRLSGPSLTPTEVHYKKGNENWGVRFRQGVFLTHVPVSEVVDTTEILPMISESAFLLGGHKLGVPAYETMDEFIARLEDLGLLSEDKIVKAVLEGGSFGASKRSVQRRFGRTIGMTPAYITQIERAWRAVELLQGGTKITEVVNELGYADQAHLNRNLKRITGFTPRQNAKRGEPL